MAPEIEEIFITFLKGKGLRQTSQRRVIMEAAFSTQEHFTADELWEMAREIDPKASRATLYRTLGLLVESGLLREIDLGRDNICYDPNFLESPNHNHLICIDCQKVVEFEDRHIEILEDCLTRRLGFRPTKKSIRIEAECDEFQATGGCKNRG
jgi:Fur family ferric uptake transcriptional regulator